MNRPLRGMPLMLSLIAAHISVSSVGKRNRGGITPMTTCGRPSSMTGRADDVADRRRRAAARRDSRAPATSSPPGRSSSGSMTRPRSGGVPSIGNSDPLTRAPNTRSGRSRPVMLKVQPDSRPTAFERRQLTLPVFVIGERAAGDRARRAGRCC